MSHNHRIIKCRECDTVIGQCRCMKVDKMVVYELCNKCKIDDLLDQAQEYKQTGRVRK